MKKQLPFFVALLLASGAANAQWSFTNRSVSSTVNLMPTGGVDKTIYNGPTGVSTDSLRDNSFLPASAAFKSFALMEKEATKTAKLEYNATTNKITFSSATANAITKVGFYDIDGATKIFRVAFKINTNNYNGLTPFSFGFGNSSLLENPTITSTKPVYVAGNFPVDMYSSARLDKNSSKVCIRFWDHDWNGGTFRANSEGNTHVKWAVAEDQTMEFYGNVTENPIVYEVVDAEPYQQLPSSPATLEPGEIHLWSGKKRFGTLHISQYPNWDAFNNVINAFTFQFNTKDGTAPASQEKVIISDLSITYINEATLPVSLTSFAASKAQNGVELKWNTASETSNSHFEVLRSTDGVTFASIATINGAGNTTGATNYSFVDNSPAAGTNYYKLKQVDTDGKEVAYDDKVQVVSYGLSADDVAVTLAGGQLGVKVISYTNANASIELISISGQKVFSKKLQVAKGSSDLAYDLGNLAKGVYIARVKVGGEVKTVKLVN